MGFDLFFYHRDTEARRKACKESLRLRDSVVRAFPTPRLYLVTLSKSMKPINRSFLYIAFLLLFTSSCASKTQPAPTEEWTQLASMPTARSENAAFILHERNESEMELSS